MSPTQHRIIAILGAIAALDLAVTGRFTRLWKLAFTRQSSGGSNNQNGTSSSNPGGGTTEPAPGVF